MNKGYNKQLMKSWWRRRRKKNHGNRLMMVLGSAEPGRRLEGLIGGEWLLRWRVYRLRNVQRRRRPERKERN